MTQRTDICAHQYLVYLLNEPLTALYASNDVVTVVNIWFQEIEM